MLRIAVTGGIACGKSLVASFMREEGIYTCDADDLAHELMEPGQPLHGAVIRAFGLDVLGADGRIDRRRLGQIVFDNPEQLGRLNTLTHPVIRAAWEERIRNWEAEPLLGYPERGKVKCAAVVIPLLFEAGLDRGWDAVVCVTDREKNQIERLLARGLSEQEAGQRLAAQWPAWKKAERADYVIVNAGSVELLREQTRRVLKHILGT
ncbi:MAG: dephospho-CoA kinase [Kiritimatiellae bacterium]|nr:dephospho-CoA kinase [Kiritimatiellia bacterium]